MQETEDGYEGNNNDHRSRASVEAAAASAAPFAVLFTPRWSAFFGRAVREQRGLP